MKIELILEPYDVSPSKAPYGYTRNPTIGHLEIEPIEAQVVKEIFELCKQGKSTRGIAKTMKDNNTYLKTGKWTSDRVYKILTNSIYIGIFEYGKYCRKPQDILIVKDYCQPIIDEETWKITRANLEKNKHPNYGEHIHLFTGIIKCPDCGKILSATNSYKNSGTPQAKIYYHVTCKNPNCKSKGVHYSSDKIEEKLGRVLNELTRYMYDIESEIIVCNSSKTKDIKDIDKAIEKLKQQEKKLDCDVENGQVISNNQLAFSFVFNSLNRQSKKYLIKRLIDKIEIKRTKNYDIEITNIKFTEEFISKSSKTYLKYLDEILRNNNIGFIYKEAIDSQESEKLQEDYFIFSSRKIENEEYSQPDLENYMALLEEHFYKDGVITCPYIEDGNVTDHLTLISKI